MRYLGGKSRLAKSIAHAILSDTDRRDTYIEPMVGGGSVFCALAPHFRDAYGGDIHEDLILLYQAVASGWLPPDSLSEEQYRELKTAEPSALRGFAGFGCSFGGKWFGGYARGGKKSNGDPRNHTNESSRAVKRMLPALKDRSFFLSGYDGWFVAQPEKTVMYFDPPYKGTTGYETGTFDHEKFWDVVRGYRNQGVHVYVSEFEAPEDLECIWSLERKAGSTVRRDGQSLGVKTERLFK